MKRYHKTEQADLTDGQKRAQRLRRVAIANAAMYILACALVVNAAIARLCFRSTEPVTVAVGCVAIAIVSFASGVLMVMRAEAIADRYLAELHKRFAPADEAVGSE